jgi:hypothetical protein
MLRAPTMSAWSAWPQAVQTKRRLVASNNPAFGARLRRGRRIDELKLAAAFNELIAEHACEHAPTLVEDASIEARLDRNVTAGLLDPTFCTRRHVPDTQLSRLHDPVVVGELGGELVQIVFASVSA